MKMVALGGAIDPEGKLPSIGGSAVAFIEGRSALLVDYGSYPVSSAKRQEHARHIMSLPRMDKHVEIGGEKFPIMPRLGEISYVDEEYLKLTNECFADPSILYDMNRIDVFVTHAHADHVGGLPHLRRLFPHMRAYMTEPTLDMSRWSWYDAQRIAARKRIELFYSGWDVENVIGSTGIIHVQPFACGPFLVEPGHPGHILGARSCVVSMKDGHGPRVFCTGDISFDDQRTVRGAVLPQCPVDYIVSESTYAGKTRKVRGDVERNLIVGMGTALGRDGKVLFPALTIGRSIEIFELLLKAGVTNKFPVFIDGAAREIAAIYQKFSACYPSIGQHFVTTRAMREEILRSNKPLVMIAPSGMLVGGFSVQYFAQWAPGERNLVGLTSFQDSCLPGYSIMNVPRGTAVRLGDEKRKIKVPLLANVAHFALSAHASGEQILRMIDVVAPKTTFLVHGEESGMNKLVSKTSAHLEKTYIGKHYNL